LPNRAIRPSGAYRFDAAPCRAALYLEGVTFEADLRAVLSRELEHGVDDVRHLELLTLHGLCVAYANWSSRFPEPKPRRPHLSRELERRLKSDSVLRRTVREVIDEIAAGVDLERRLSKDVEISVNSPDVSKRRRHRDLDRFLSAWGLHHLHLGRRPKDGSRVASSVLLFVSFIGDDAYLVGAFPHGAWDRDDLLRIMAENWPGDSGPLLESRQELSLAVPISEGDRAQLRKSNVATFFPHRGRLYAARSPLTLSGTSMHHSEWANRVVRSVGCATAALATSPSSLVERARALGTEPAPQPSWRIATRDHQLAVVDERSDALVPLFDFLE
jgi:hypothetical protein